jgi:two-component system CheB/CheR fusion protein
MSIDQPSTAPDAFGEEAETTPGCVVNDAAGSVADENAHVEMASGALQSSPTYPIVGIGASAGGLEALETFFERMPVDSGMAFVVVQHLSPDFKSVMDELLGRRTKIPIHRVSDGIEVHANAIYLIPPKKEMIISAGKLLLSDKEPGGGLTLPIDVFFRSLAQEAGPRAVGIVLSGTGSDGSRGICDIHEAGGFVIAQDLESARFDGMPKSAVETGVVDLVLPPERIPSALMSFVKHPCAQDLADFLPSEGAALEGIDAVFQLLRKAYDIDFSHYKRTTVTRRVQRRLAMNQITDLAQYIERLRGDPQELNLLYKDLLIGVTKFFRDREAFERLEREILPELIGKARSGGELRFWVAGCATGEEAYSLAILLREHQARSGESLPVKIFATDVHRASLECASAGVYSEASLSEVAPERLARYFTRVKNGYQVAPELRQMIVFAPHNVIKDAPFTKIDLISCRNLLIYLAPLAQKKVISLFHFALNPRGVLVMGPSESPGELADEFEPIDERWKFFRKRREKRLPPDIRLPSMIGYGPGRLPPIMGQAPRGQAGVDGQVLRAYDELLQEYAPPSLLINGRRELVHSFSGASAYLKLRDGRPSNDVLDLVVEDLRTPLATAVQQAVKKQSAVTLQGVRVHVDSAAKEIKLTVRPIADRMDEGEHYLVSLDAQFLRMPAQAEEGESIDLKQASHDRLQALEAELQYTKENLQATVEEMETSNEELQAANEELVASNEELQSTNEELHSVNEELYTVNAEYQKKIGELTEMTADLDSLLQSTEVGVIYLDRDLCIRKFTPKIAEMFHLLPVDIGRRIDSFSHNLDRPGLLDDVRKVLDTETPFEIDVRADQGRHYLLRILPYRARKRLEGVVLTLIDIGKLKRAEADLRLMSKVFTDGADPIMIEGLDGVITNMNDEAARTYGWRPDELIGRSVNVLIPESEQQRARELRAQCMEVGCLRNIETVERNKKGEPIPVLLTLSLLSDESGQPLAIATIAKDITDRKKAEAATREAVQSRDRFLAMLSHELRNPLGAALNASYLLDQAGDGPLPQPVLEAAKVIQRQSLQAARLLDDLLDVARVTQGKIEMRRQIVDLTQLVEDAAQAVRPVVESRNHALHIHLPPGPLCIEGDPARVLQIQENLLVNAAKYTPMGGRIDLTLSQENGEAVIRVRDNGKGIPSHMLEAIFDLFAQRDETLDRADGGMGLGLTLVRNLVELHRGKVTAHSEGVGKGSEFVVRLPLADALLLGQPCGGDEILEPARPQRIVVVEDNDDSRLMLQTLLKLDGHDVTAAKDGRQGLEMILELRPDAAILDIGLPGMNGYEIAREVRKAFGRDGMRLIALTGYGRKEDNQAVQEAGFDVHLVKPLKPADLNKALFSRRIQR